jgi:membrane protease subunit (stomatin/prohibitin family)
MMRRRRRPLLRAGMAAGAGYMAGKHMERGRDADADRDARLDDVERQQQAAPPPQQSSGGISDAAIAQLKQLAQLHEQGILTDAEFDAQKQKLLSGA